MSKSYKVKYFLLLILIVGVFVMPSNFFGNMTKNIIDHIKYRGALVTGEITADNGDGTYNVKINNASGAYKNVETVTYGAIFSVGEIVVIGYEYGNKELPKILGHAKKIPQEPKLVEVDYSGGEARGGQVETVTIYSNSYDGSIQCAKDSYDEAHDAKGDDPDISIIDNDIAMQVSQFSDDTGSGCCRSFLFFDTSSIPTNAKITSATLSIFGIQAFLDVDFYVVIQDGQPNYPRSPLVKDDYYFGYYVNNGGQILASDIEIGSYSNIILNSNGRNWINKGGITKLCLRSLRDIAKKSPSEGVEEGIMFYASEQGEGYAPKLVITYEI